MKSGALAIRGLGQRAIFAGSDRMIFTQSVLDPKALIGRFASSASDAA